MCPRYGTCRFFESPAAADKGPIVEIERNRYCLEDSAHCARYQVASVLGEDAVPADLFPHETARAADVVFARE